MEMYTPFSFDMHKVIAFFNKYRTYVLAGLVAAGLIISGIIYMYLSHMKRNQSALHTLTELLVDHDRAFESADLWQEIEFASQTGQRQYAKTSMSPYFLALQAEALLHQDKLDEALSVMEKAVQQVLQSPLYPMYALKYARMKIASENQATREEGLRELTRFAEDNKNPEQEQAQYYVGLYYHLLGQIEKAQELWRLIVDKYKGAEATPARPSVWAAMAERSMQ
jgi:predicted Zn-dependent protease